MRTKYLAIETYLAKLLVCFFATFAIAEDQTKKPEKGPSFAKQVQPILAEYCYACHGADAESRKADLRLDVRDSALEMDAIVPGKVDESELIARILSDDEDLVMPPPEVKKNLSDAEKEILKKWIENGAEYEAHWAFEKPKRPAVPKVSDEGWCQNDIDRFVLATLESKGLSPAPKADPAQLFRRIHLDITGLPPNPSDFAKFKLEYAKEKNVAVEKWIDRLMDQPAWGEHRARFWLDAARYADTHGLHFDNYREMWAYRDWVIKSFNRNQRFDQFTVEQLAGDLLPNPTQDQLIATGFQRCNITTNEGGTIAAENLANYAADRVQTFGWVYLGLTTNCAQCHDHKFDPISTKEYYSLAAYFRNTTQGSHDGNVKDGRGPSMKVMTDEALKQIAEIENRSKTVRSEITKRKAVAKTEFDKWLETADPADIAKLGNTPSLHLLLNEGKGKELVNQSGKSDKIKVNNIRWEKDKRFGNAARITNRNVLTLGDFGNFELDESFSISVWINTNSVNGSTAVLGRMNEPKGYRGWDIFREGDSIAVHLIDNWPGNATKARTPTQSIKAKKWHHVLVTFDGSRALSGLRIYIDGVNQKLTTLTNSLRPNATMQTNTPLKLGQRSGGSVFDGLLTNFQIFEKSLSEVEAKTLAKEGSLKSLLAEATEKRTPENVKKLFELYLDFVDQPYQKLQSDLRKMSAKAKSIRDNAPVTHVQKEKPNSPAMANILMRGAYDKIGEKVDAGTPSALHSLPKDATPNRMGLAKWVIDSDNPLTSRVTVNRFWQELFGAGIVSTTEDFGLMGAAPSHPKLLDYLATEFVSSGWDVKKFYKSIMLSATYQQSARNTEKKERLDRDNRFLSRGPRFRMDAEMIRDYALASSDLLSRKMYGPGIKPYQPSNLWNIVGLPGGDTRNYVQDKGEKLYRRSIYMFWKRMQPPANLEALNAPSREVCVVRRERTNTPLQALVTLNDPQFVEAARVLAENAIASAKDFEQRLDFVSQRLLNRKLKAAEREIVSQSYTELSKYYKSKPVDAKKLIKVGEKTANAKIDVPELAAWTMICNQLLNLDEVLNK